MECSGVRVSRAHVALQVAPPRQRRAALRARVRRASPRGPRARLRVQPHVLVEVAGVAERAQAVPAPQRLVAGVRADVDLEPVLARVQLAAVHAHVAGGRAAPRRRQRLQLGGRGGRGRGVGRGRGEEPRGGARAAISHVAPLGAERFHCHLLEFHQAVLPKVNEGIFATFQEKVNFERIGLFEFRPALVAYVVFAP